MLQARINPYLLIMLAMLAAVGQMAQTIYVPAIPGMADAFSINAGAIQRVMAMYLMAYGGSQLFYGPLADRFGRRPIILIGMVIFALGSIVAMFSSSLDVLVIASGLQGLGAGVGGVMSRTVPRDLYSGFRLRQANSRLNVGLLLSPLLAPLIGAMLASLFGWRSCYLFLLLLSVAAFVVMARYFRETRAATIPVTSLFFPYKKLLSDSRFIRYLLLLTATLAGICVFESSCGVLLGDVLGLSKMEVSILFILPIPAAVVGAWCVGRVEEAWGRLMWYGIGSCLFAGVVMWLPSCIGVMSSATLLIPTILFFFGAGMLFPLATSGAMEPHAQFAGSAGALIGGIQNLGAGLLAWLSALLPQHDQSSIGMLMLGCALIMLLCWWSLCRSKV